MILNKKLPILYLINRLKTQIKICLIYMVLACSSAYAAEISHFNLSEINDINISAKLNYYQYDHKRLPDSHSELLLILPGLKPHLNNEPTGDRFFTLFELTNDTEESHWFVYPYGSVVESIQLHQYKADERNVYYSGYQHKNHIEYHYGSNIIIQPGETQVIAVLYESNFFFAPIKLVVSPMVDKGLDLKLENLTLLICLGIGLALSIYNLFIFIGSRERMYLYYALSTFCYMWGWAHVFGVIETVTYGDHSSWSMPPFLLGTAFSCYFAIKFLDLDRRARILYWIMHVIGIISLLCIPVAYISPGIGIALASLASGSNLMIGLVAGILSWRKGYAPAKYFVFAFLAVVIPNMVGNLMNLGVLPGLNVNIYLLGILGNTADSLLLAFALAEKVRFINQKVQELTGELENKVEMRTQALMSANQTLEHLIDELQEANETKNRFLANMSHEIRTPLTSIIGYADGVLLGDISKEEQHRVLKIISDNGSHLLNVINDILDLNKIEADKLEFELIPTPLFAVLTQIESVSGKRARDEGLSFEHHYQYPLPSEIDTDPTRLKQILFNLTNNALKFTEKGQVSIDVKVDGDHLIIAICDMGIGLDAKQQEELFSPFKQADNSITRRFGGTGLGLSISQHLAKGLGGDIRVSSVKSQGSEFSLAIGLKTTSDTIWVNSVEEVWQSTPTKTFQQNTLPAFAHAKVLLADDHPNNRELVAALLKRMKINVTAVENGQQAIDAVFYQRFDLILMDIHMPEVDGIQAFKQIRSQGCETPIIALTANNMKHEVEEYLEIGFNDHLAKPIARHHFVEKLDLFLQQNIREETVIDNSDMQGLIRDYASDLKGYLQEVSDAWEQQNLQELQDIAHRIKGSAGSFGFSRLGLLFADIETQLKEERHEDLQQNLSAALAYGQQCIHIPGVNIAKAIVNHQFNIDQYHQELECLLSGYQPSLERLSDAVANSEPNSALIYLHKLMPDVQQLALDELDKLFTQLSHLLHQGSIYPDECLPLVKAVKHQFEALDLFYQSKT